ncbi:MAG: hypothetical protein P8L85_02250 [Rubripirellula sp.]|nr:hypothetical protein [Rubripirellula sp.]
MSEPPIDPNSTNASPERDRSAVSSDKSSPILTDEVEQVAPAIHADKFNDPRAKITTRGIAIGVVIFLLGIAGAFGSIYARRTQLVESTRFWGEETITALQLAERVELLPAGNSQFEPVELTTTPGLGHLRRALLDERNYQWDTETSRPALENCPAAEPTKTSDRKLKKCIRLRLTDPTAQRFDTVQIDINLGAGWIGPSDGSRRVQATPYVQPKLQSYFATIVNVEQLRYDLRE